MRNFLLALVITIIALIAMAWRILLAIIIIGLIVLAWRERERCPLPDQVWVMSDTGWICLSPK